MSTIDFATGITLTGADLDAAREFVDRATITAAETIGGDTAEWPTIDEFTVHVGDALRVARFGCIRENLADGNHWPLSGDMVAMMRDAAHLALNRQERDTDDPPRTGRPSRDATRASLGRRSQPSTPPKLGHRRNVWGEHAACPTRTTRGAVPNRTIMDKPCQADRLGKLPRTSRRPRKPTKEKPPVSRGR